MNDIDLATLPNPVPTSVDALGATGINLRPTKSLGRLRGSRAASAGRRAAGRPIIQLAGRGGACTVSGPDSSAA
jgi:hypothetical protein